jgi:hypothetical protein
MRSTCIQHPTREPLVIFRQWQLAFCESNHCAAALLSLFEYWHNIRLDLSEQAQQANAAARKHGQPTTQEESLLQFHSDEQLQAGLLDLYGTMKIRAARRLLVAKGAITEHPNPNPRYAFDKTLYFQFHPEVVNAWLEQRHNLPAANSSPADEHNPPSDQNASSGDSSINNATCAKNGERVAKNGGSYTEITYEITSETTTTPPPPSFTEHAQRPPQPEGSSSSGGDDGSKDEEKTQVDSAELIFDGPLVNLNPIQQERARRIVSELDPDTAQQVLDDWGQAIKTNSIQKSKWAWLEGVTRKARAGMFTSTTDAAERRQAEKRRREAEETSIRRIPTQSLPQPINRPKSRPAGLQALLQAVSPLLARAE